MRKLLLVCCMLFFISETFSQSVSIPIKNVTPLKLSSEYIKIKDTSDVFIKSGGYEMNQRFWKIHFRSISLDYKTDLINFSGVVSISSDDIEDSKINNFDIYLGMLKNDTLINVKRLNEIDFIKEDYSFEIQFNLKEYYILIFSSFHRLPRIYDLSSLLYNELKK